MNQIRSLGPSFVLLTALVATLIGGPFIMRELAYADVQARVDMAGKQLESAKLSELNESFKAISRHVEPSVVHVSVKRRIASIQGRPGVPPEMEEFFKRFGDPRFRENQPGEEGEDFREYDAPRTVGSGSGWVYDDQGHIVTNYHVVSEADVIEVKFFDESTREAKVVGVDPNTDIAVLKIKDDHLHPATLAEKSPDQGELVFAFGSPFSFDFSMSQGIVSGNGRQLGILGRAGYENFIQTDAAINPGNSGGPLTNIYGQVVGMNTAIATRTGGYQGIGFAIPVDMLRKIIPQLIDDGRVARGYLGVMISDDPKLLKTFGLDQGIVVDNVMEDSPADKAGLKRGDVIVEIDGKTMRDTSHLRSTIADFGPDAVVKLVVVRDGKRKKIDVTLSELPADLAMGNAAPRIDRGDDEPTDAEVLRKLGIERVQTMTKELARQAGLPYEDGVLIVKVRPGSVAATEGLTRSMLIRSVQGKSVDGVEGLVKALADRDLTQGVRLSVGVPEEDGWTERFVVLQLNAE